MDYGIQPPGYRLPDETHIGRVTLQVSDLARSAAYYQTVIGLRVIEHSGASVRLGAHGDDTPILELRERTGARAVPRRGLLGLYHFAILLPDRASLGRFLLHLGELGLPAGMSDHLVSEAIYLQDPDNLGIEVYADRPREAWQHSDRQLAMASEALDTRDLAAAAGSESWKGVPAGTRIGHVHLHVGDIAQAEAFYHCAVGFDKVVWSYPGALFLSAGGYHHHLGINTWARGAPSAGEDDARLIEWEIVVPAASDVTAAAASMTAGGYVAERAGASAVARDPWGTQLRFRDRGSGTGG